MGDQLTHDKNDRIYGGYVLTQRGRFYLDGSAPESISIIDIAISLSRKGRWSDLGRRQLVVAEHTLYVSKLAEAIAHHDGHGEEIAAQCAFHGLHHDDHEAYPPGELATPCKVMMPKAEEMGDQQQAAIYAKFGWPEPSDLVKKLVKEADKIAAHKEGPVLFPGHPDTEAIGLIPRHPDLDHEVPHDEPARRDLLVEWLARHRDLEGKLGFKPAS